MDFRKLYQKIAEMDGSGMVPHDTTSAINGDEFQSEPVEESHEEYVACIVQHDRSGQAMVQRTKPISRDRAEEIIKNALSKSTFKHPPFMTIYPASAGKLDASTIMAKFPDMSQEAGPVDTGMMEATDIPVEECGDMMPMPMSAPKQSDSVTMNISMNGSGAGGIRDLMSILRDIEHGGEQGDSMPHPDDLELDIKSMDHPHDEPAHDEHGEEDGIVFGNDMEEEYANQPDEMYAPVDAMVNPPSNDLNKPKQMYKHSYHQGDNAMAMESLRSNLENLYKEVKSR